MRGMRDTVVRALRAGPAAPETCHPAYAVQRETLVRWLECTTEEHALVPVELDAPVAVFGCDQHALIDTAELRAVRELVRCKATGPAPYVGEPFRYAWWVGIDDLGRTVATSAWREPEPPRDEPLVLSAAEVATLLNVLAGTDGVR